MSETDPLPGTAADDQLSALAANQLEPLSAAVEETFTELSRSVADELARLSVESRQSMRDMVDGILDDLARLAAEELIRGPLERALGGGVQNGAERGGQAIGDMIRRGLRNG